jgi:hypothetical protein
MMTERGGLLRLAALVGTSSALYALALGTVATLQAQADAAMNAQREPTVRAIEDIAAGNDRLGATLRGDADRYGDLLETYDRLTADIDALNGSVGVLGEAVAEVNGRAAALPPGVSMPRLTRPASVQVTRTVVHATTGASGG